MKPLTCAATRRRLQAFYDRELAVADEIAVASHLDWCDRCAEALNDFELVRVALRTVAPGRNPLSREEAAGFNLAVVNRVRAEQDASFVVGIRKMFEDMHLVYAGLGAAAAAVVCVVIMLGMMRYATNERSDSLAAIVDLLATPGSNADSVALDAASHARWALRSQLANESAMEDAVFTLQAIVTREGGMAMLQPMRWPSKATLASHEAELVQSLLDALSRAQLESAEVDGLKTSNVVWLMTHTTVRATKALDLPLPGPTTATKKRVV